MGVQFPGEKRYVTLEWPLSLARRGKRNCQSSEAKLSAVGFEPVPHHPVASASQPSNPLGHKFFDLICLGFGRIIQYVGLMAIPVYRAYI